MTPRSEFRFTLRSALRGAAALALAFAVGGCEDSMPTEVRMTCIPDGTAADLEKLHTAIAARLTKEVGVPFKFQPVADYNATVSALASKNVELVWYGGFTSLQAIKQSNGNAERIAMREQDLKFKSVFIKAKGSPIASLADLKGKTFTFGSNSSTSGHLMPRWFLMQAGIDPEKDFAKKNHSKSHDETIDLVADGAVDAGALNYLTWDKRKAKEGDKALKCEVFHTTAEYVDYCWVMRKDLPAALRESVKKAFLSLDPAKPDDKALLDGHKASKYVACPPDSAWGELEKAARAAGMIKD